MRLIDADELKKDDEIILWLSNDAVRTGKTLKMFSELFIKKIDEQPTIQLDPKTGHWVEENINGGHKVFCSECGCPPPFEYVSTGDVYSASGYGVINKTKFCPNCGTRMMELK